MIPECRAQPTLSLRPASHPAPLKRRKPCPLSPSGVAASFSKPGPEAFLLGEEGSSVSAVETGQGKVAPRSPPPLPVMTLTLPGLPPLYFRIELTSDLTSL